MVCTLAQSVRSSVLKNINLFFKVTSIVNLPYRTSSCVAAVRQQRGKGRGEEREREEKRREERREERREREEKRQGEEILGEAGLTGRRCI